MHCRAKGQWFQSESGLHQNWMRDYDPTTGRYIQADPLGLVDGASVYGYARQNPGRYVDPRGEQTLLVRISPWGRAWQLGALAGRGINAAFPEFTVALAKLVVGSGESVRAQSDGTARSKQSPAINLKAQKAQERKSYSRFCKTPPPPTGNFCDDLLNKFRHAKQCLQMRRDFGRKWFSDNERGHMLENRGLANRVRRLRSEITEMCPNHCDQLRVSLP